MKRFLYTVLGAVAGYISGGVLGYLLVHLFSSNLHDRELEAAMTGAFFSGPVIAIVSAIVGFILGGRKGRRDAGT
jgi:F0F1-type ATP synthase membrane subunit c/vacuolar-type H+-ATPase subunit K